MLNNNVVALKDEDKSGYYVTLELYQYREGELIDKRIIEDDYILRNWVYTWLNMLAGDRMGDAYNNYKLTDINNIERSFTSKVWFSKTMDRVRLGTGTNPVAVTNYQLQTELFAQVPDDGHIWVTGNQFNVTTDATIVSDGSYSITECGLSIGIGDSVNVARDILICRDVFSPIAVNNADVIVVRYIFRFNLGV